MGNRKAIDNKKKKKNRIILYKCIYKYLRNVHNHFDENEIWERKSSTKQFNQLSSIVYVYERY